MMVKWFGKLLGRGEEEREPPTPPLTTTRQARAVPVGGLPRFLSTAGEQLGGSGTDPVSRARLRLRDAFTPSQPVADPDRFAGRSELLASIIRAIEVHRLHVVLFGDRGTGKTSLMHVLARQAQDARYLVHYASCGEDADFGEMFRSIAADVPLLYHGGYSPTASETEQGGSLATLLPAGPLNPRQVSDLFARLTGTRLLVILDEFDRARAGAFRRQVAELIKNLSDRSIRVQIVIAGVAANLTELIEHIPSIRRNILGLPMPGMTPQEVAELIRNGERASGVAFEPPAVEMIVRLAAGSPYLAGLLAQHAGIAATDDGRVAITTRDVAVAVDRTAAELRDRLSERSRHAVERARRDGHASALALLGHEALRHGGRFSPAVLSAADLAGRDVQETVDMLNSEYGLVERIEGDPVGGHRFIEEVVPVYLWMIEARSGLDRP